MDRRTYLGSLGMTGVAGIAGCLDTVGFAGDDSRTVLGPPSEERGEPIHPVHGDEFPSFSLPDPLSDETVSLEDFVGERAFLMTYIFTACPDGACPALLLRLRRVQEDAAERGYEDDVALLAMTFDPERDTPDVLEQYGAERGVDYEADNWHFLRPETYEEGEKLLDETFGMPIQRIDDPDEHDFDDDHGDHDDDHDDHDHGEYTFNHYNLIVLVNDEGIVERAYPNAVEQREEVSIETIVEDARTVAQH
ncbi:SCO family protein [Natrarchaeobius oligotrophus]|uniref:SCO family protein n=1 Tax=Natrarchaeobius chitinivorans TaxID=1679083 RepID=A0A3N6M9I9_NATCH|nr:SCO family protein [Natrarchaeobius chitinivorans]RQH00389.1 SCO family protein [Natrarchaeobius chitinivorans]